MPIKQLVVYETAGGKAPFLEWMSSKKLDARSRAAVDARLNRLMVGLEGDRKPLGGGLLELRIHYGAGYRIYYAHHGQEIVVLLAGGDKGTQVRDISAAERNWADYRRRNQL
jgi:putative addiction module killer protein